MPWVSILILLFAVAAGRGFGVAGDVIRSFSLTGQPANGVRGLAKDWADGNIWAAGLLARIT